MAKCSDFLIKAVRKTQFMNDEDAELALKELEARAKKFQQLLKTDRKSALKQASSEMIEEQKEKAREQARVAYKSIQAIILINKDIKKPFVRAGFTRKPLEKRETFQQSSRGLIAEINGDLGSGFGRRLSMNALMNTISAQLINRLYFLLSKDNLFEDFQRNRAFQVQITKEIYDPKSTGDDRAFLAAQHMSTVLNDGRLLLNREGANIKKDPNFMFNQTSRVEKMGSPTGNIFKDNALLTRLAFQRGWHKGKEEWDRLAYVRWRDFMLPLLDRAKTFLDVPNDGMEQFMRKSFDAMLSGIHLKDVVENGGALEDLKRIARPSRLAKFSKAKVFHFKGGEEALLYDRKYGAGGLNNAVFSTLRRMGTDIGIMRKFGPNAATNFQKIVDNIRADETERKDPKLEKRLINAENMFNQALGVNDHPVNQNLANWGRAFRAFTILTKGGRIVLTALEDVAQRASEMQDRGVGVFDSWRAVFQRSLKGMTKKERQEFASWFNVFTIGHQGISASRWVAEDSGPGVLSHGVQLLFKYTGLNSLERWNVETHALGEGANLGRQRNLRFDELDPLEQRIMQQYKIGPAEWDYYRENATTVAGTDDTHFIVPDMIRRIGNVGLDKYLKSQNIPITRAAEDQAIEELSQRLGAYFNDRTGHAQMTPDLRDKTFILGNSRPGTPRGEFLRAVAIFKHFTLTFARRKMGRAIFGGTLKGNPDIIGILKLMFSSSMLGMAINDITAITELKKIRPLSLSSVAAGLARGWGGSIYSDFLFGQYNRFGQSIFGTIAGPSAATVEDFTGFMSALIHMDHPGDAAFKLLERETPFINVWYAKTALDYLFLYSLAEQLSPGYLERMQRSLQKNQDTQFLLPPSQFALRPFG